MKNDSQYPPDGTWCWVQEGKGRWFPAKRDSAAVGGWTNDDTWEDFFYQVVEWVPIKPPDKEGDETPP